MTSRELNDGVDLVLSVLDATQKLAKIKTEAGTTEEQGRTNINYSEAVGTIQIQCMKIALSDYAASGTSSSEHEISVQDRRRAVLGCLTTIAGVLGLIAEQLTIANNTEWRCRGDVGLEWRCETIFELRKAEICRFLVRVEDFVHVLAKVETLIDSPISQQNLKIRSLDQEKEQETKLDEAAGFVVELSTAIRIQEDGFKTDPIEQCLSTLVQIVTGLKTIVQDTKAELDELVQDPESVYLAANFGLELYDSDSESDTSPRKSNRSKEELQFLVSLAQKLSIRANYLQILFTSIVKRRLTKTCISAIMTSKDSTADHNADSNVSAAASYLDQLHHYAVAISPVFDTLVCSLYDIDDSFEAQKLEISSNLALFKAESVRLPQLAATALQDKYSPWFATWIDRFNDDL
ncbi:uncharacterized protein V1516DRAFT_681934 [Lipomyces oligophaga]|uniref:uncharacterized protein n=1 Tax=Lipomyces oligophaga TaxID=45792 RepID=UPI0034CDFFA7